MKNKNVLLLLLAVILFCYAFLIGIMPMILNDGLKNKTIIPELEKLTLLKIDYDSAKITVKPDLSVKVKFNNLKAEKRDVEMKVGSISMTEIELSPLALFTKNYQLKSMKLRGVDYYEVIDKGLPEIQTFLEEYSLLSTAGRDYKIKTCPIEIKYLIKYSFNTTTQEYKETKYDSFDINAESAAKFIDLVSKGSIKTSY